MQFQVLSQKSTVVTDVVQIPNYIQKGGTVIRSQTEWKRIGHDSPEIGMPPFVVPSFCLKPAMRWYSIPSGSLES